MNVLSRGSIRWLIGLMLIAGLSSPLQARIALVIGNSQYPTAALTNPVNDATDIAAQLRELGFEVNMLLDASRRDMRRAIRDHSEKLRLSGEVGLFYYAGHGMQIKGVNYLIPTDAVMQSEFEIPDEAVSANSVLRALEEAGNNMNIVILDACRDNPFAKSYRSTATRGLARMDAPGGSFIAYATAPGNTALDGDGRNGVYTKHLLANLEKPGMPIEQMFKKVRIGVIDESAGHQTPWEESSLRDDFYFAPAAVTEVVLPAKQAVQVVSTAESSESSASDGTESVRVAAAAPAYGPTDQELQAERVSGLLERAAIAIQETRMTTPERHNALYYYREVLAIDPVNFDAHDGIQLITRHYIALAEQHLRHSEVDRAERLINQGLDVQPDNYQLLALRTQVDELRVQQTMLAARQNAASSAPLTNIETVPDTTPVPSPRVDQTGSAAPTEIASAQPEMVPQQAPKGLERPGRQSPVESASDSVDTADKKTRMAMEIKKDVDQLKSSLTGFGLTLKRGFKEVMRPKKKQPHHRR